MCTSHGARYRTAEGRRAGVKITRTEGVRVDTSPRIQLSEGFLKQIRRDRKVDARRNARLRESGFLR
jgi:hypothetical protein|nr:MAG TPA: hypothetical protein [Caudoviricetes sp.]